MLTEEKIREHYRHKCSTGYDPLLCVHLTWYPIRGFEKTTNAPILDKDDIKHYRHKYYHIDQVITEDRYVELIKKTQAENIDDLTDVDKLDVQKVWLPMENANEEQAAVFWLKPPSECKTLVELFNVYEAKIRIMFGSW